MLFYSNKKLRFIIAILILGVSLFSCKAKQVRTEEQKPKPKTEVKKTEPLKKDTVVQKPAMKTGTLNFLLFLPADLAGAFEIDTISPDSIVVNENYSKDLVQAIHFYEGALLAVDSLRKAGHDVKLKVVDLPGDEERQSTKLWIQKYDNVHLVFSMLKGKPLKTLNGILALRKIPLISCATNTCSVIEKNPAAICVQPSSLTQCAMMGAYVGSRFKGDNIVIITGAADKEKEWAAAFVSVFTDTVARARIKKVNFSTEGAAALTKSLAVTYTNTLFVPSTDEDFVTTIYSALQAQQPPYRFRVIGLPVWQHFESLDPRMLEKYNTLLFAAEYYAYDENTTLHFRRKFRQQFGTEPADEAYLAYDSFLQFGNLYIQGQLPFDAPETKLTGLRSKYLFQRADSAAAENQYINVMKIENFRYVKMNHEN